MRAGGDGRTLALARKTALVLFACSVLLPLVTVLRRDAAGVGASSDAGSLDEAAFSASDGRADAGSARVRHQETWALPSIAPPDAPAGTRVLVFLAREIGSMLQLHVRTTDGRRDVCSGATAEGETVPRAALRVLWECAALGPPPDIEFIERVSVALEPGAPFVALVRSERLLLRGSAGALLQSLTFEALQSVVDAAATSAGAYAPGVPEALPFVSSYLAPWSATAGKKAGACAPTAARLA